MKQTQQQPTSSSSGTGSGSGDGSGGISLQHTRTPSSRSINKSNVIQTAKGRSAIQSLDEAAELLDEEGGYEGEDGEDDDEEGQMPFSEQGSEGGGQELMNETSVKSGYLYKRGEKRKNWKKRWFVLRSSKLYYYKNEKEYQLLRFIDMSDIHTIAPVQLKKIEHCFGISTSKRQFYVRATSANEMQSWVDAIRDVREQVRQRSTLTRDMALLDVGNLSSGGENVAGTPNTMKGGKPPSQLVSSPTSMNAPLESIISPKGKQGAGSQPISIVIPGKGLYTAPPQPRQTTGGTIISPLSATSDSEAGGPSGAEQFGLSYTSSAGQSQASSPGRVGLYNHLNPIQHQHHHQGHHQLDYSSGGDEMIEGIRPKNFQRRSSGNREASVGSSTGGEGASGFGMDRRGSQSQLANQILSSSDEEGEGDEWDEEEGADMAMPLPDPSGKGGSSGLGHAPQQKQSQSSTGSGSALTASSSTMTTASSIKPKVGPEFFKDSSKVIHQGYLMKQSSRRRQWRKRWFILTSGSLSYTRSHMDARPHRQIALSSILDAIEYTSKKANQQSGGPLSPSLSAFGGNNPLASFGRSPLLGGNSDFKDGPERKGSQKLSSSMATHSSNAGLALSSDVEHGGGISAGEAESGTERRGSNVMSTGGSSLTHLPSTKKKKENCFKIVTPKRVYVVCAPTEEEELKWLSALQALLAHYHEKDANNNAITPKPQDSTATGGGSGLQDKQDQEQQSRNQSILSPSQIVSSPPQMSTAGGSNRLNPPSISLSKPVRQGSQDDNTRPTSNVTQEGLKAT